MKIQEEVLTHLSTATCKGRELRLSSTLDRGEYARVKKVIEAAGGKWARSAAAHVFPGDAQEAVDSLILTGNVTVPADLGQFDTPPEVAAMVIEAANITPGMRVLEPSAGTGALVAPAVEDGGKVYWCEIDPKRHAALALRFPERSRLGDFLQADPDRYAPFDRVVMNPPFAPGQADIHHVMHALQFLKPGGRLVSIMSAGVIFRENRLTTIMRDTIRRTGGTVRRLPPKSFRISGTNVETVLVTMDWSAA